MKRIQVPESVEATLIKLHHKDEVTEQEEAILHDFLTELETAIVNPACPSKILVNPTPNEVVVEHQHERSLEDRIRHINTVNHRIRMASQPEPEEERDNFNIDDSFDLLPKSIFEIAEHEEAPYVEEVLEPAEPDIQPNPDIEPADEPIEPAPI